MFARLETKRIASNNILINVKPLPNNLELFGKFNISVTVDKKEVEANKPVKVGIRIDGYGNIDDIKKFDLKIPDAVVYADEPKIDAHISNGKYGGTFMQTITVVAQSNFTIPSLTLKFVDSETNQPTEIKSEPIKIFVKGGVVKQPEVVKKAEMVKKDNKKVMIIGGGPNRTGQGIEFDYCCVHASYALKDMGITTIMYNCNPETVSTDYDTSDILYFEPIDFEHVRSVVERENPDGIIVHFGGQTPLKIAKRLTVIGGKIIGTTARVIDEAEDREKFSAFIKANGLKQPKNAISAYDDFIKTKPKKTQLQKVYSYLGKLYEDLNNKTKARVNYSKSLQIHYDRKIAMKLIQLNFEAKRFSQAKKLISSLLAKNTNDTYALYYRAQIRYKEKDLKGAKADFEKVKDVPAFGSSARQFIKSINSEL